MTTSTPARLAGLSLSLASLTCLAAVASAQEPTAASPPANAPAQTEQAGPPAPSEPAQRLVEVMRIRETVQGTLDRIRSRNPDIEAEAWSRFSDRVLSEELFDRIARLYDRRFTEAELTRITDFYASPVGRKLVESQAGLNEEIRGTIQSWTAIAARTALAEARRETAEPEAPDDGAEDDQAGDTAPEAPAEGEPTDPTEPTDSEG
jgi:hypothetical protein